MARRRKSRRGRRGHSMRGMLRRRNFPMTLSKRKARKYHGTDVGGAYSSIAAARSMKKRLARRRKFGYTMMLRRKGWGKYKGKSRAARHIGRPRKVHRRRAKRHTKARSRKRAGKRHLTAAHKRKMMAGLRRWQRKHRRSGRKGKRHVKARARKASRKSSRRRSGRRHRPSRKAIRAMQRGLRRWRLKKRALKASRLRNLRKGRRTRSRKLYGRRPLIRRAARRVKKLRPGTRISKIRRLISRDLRHKAHRAGRGRSAKTLARDAVFGIDYRRALRGQHVRPRNMRHGSWIRRMGRHPSHMRRRLARRVVRGWKEFAGYRPNLVASFKSPVRGQFNGVLIQKLAGSCNGTSANITPPSGKELWFMWSNGGRTFEVVGGPSAITSLAKAMARAGRPIRLRRIDYAAMRYPVAQNARRTSSTRASVLFYHTFVHECYLSWNGKSGTRARFPIIVRGGRGASMVSRSGITL